MNEVCYCCCEEIFSLNSCLLLALVLSHHTGEGHEFVSFNDT